MTTMIQIRNVPHALHRRLKARAARAGVSLSEYLVGELSLIAERPTRQELADRISALPPVFLDESPAEILRGERKR